MNETRRVADKAQVLRFKSWMRDRQASDDNIAYEEAEAMLAEVDADLWIYSKTDSLHTQVNADSVRRIRDIYLSIGHASGFQRQNQRNFDLPGC
jgi:hypothetical protein